MLVWLRRSMRGSSGSMGAALGALDEFYNPAAARARESLKVDNERVMPTPSPGDKILEENRIIIQRGDSEPR